MKREFKKNDFDGYLNFDNDIKECEEDIDEADKEYLLMRFTIPT